MIIVILLARVLLATVFAVAGFAKLTDRDGLRRAVIDFGVPIAFAPPLTIALPLTELTVVVALLIPVAAWWGALGALVLLLLFIAGIGYNLAHGHRPDCHCFGQLHSTPAGWPTLIRNLLLAAMASVVIGFGQTNSGLSPLYWLEGMSIVQCLELLFSVVVLLLLAVLGWMLLHVLQQQGRLLIRIEALDAASGLAKQPLSETLPLGSRAPTFMLPRLNGARLTLEVLRSHGKPVVLIFSDPNCGPCTALLPEVAVWQHAYTEKLTLALISRGRTSEANITSEYGITHVLLQQDREVAEAYHTSGTPTAVLVRPDGTIGSAFAAGAEAIRALVAGAVEEPMLRRLPMAAYASSNGHTIVQNQEEPGDPR